MSKKIYEYETIKNDILGRSKPVRDASLKVTGQLSYVDDMFFPNMLYGKILFSPKAHAIIKSIDTSKALNLPGVRAVVTYEDSPKNRYNGNGEDRIEFPTELVFDKKLRYIGDKVAAVAADTAEIAANAIKLIEVEYEDLPVYLTPEEALKEGAVLIHENGNVPMEVNLSSGDVDNAFEESFKVYERTYEMPPIYHCPMEPHCCIATYDFNGKLTLITPTQDPFGMRDNLQRIFELSMNNIRVVNPAMGGGFGGKNDLILEPVAAMLAMKTMRPVKMVLTRAEDMASGRTRHGMKVKNKIGVDKEGHILAMDVEALINAGAHTGCTMSVTWAMGGKVFKNLKTKNIRFKGIPVYTNITPAGAMRGFGSPQAFFGEQCLMNTIANDLNISPAKIQEINLVDPYDIDPSNGDCHGNARIKDCLNKAMELIDYDKCQKEQEETKNDRYKIGVGIGCGGHGSSLFGIFADTSAVTIKMNDDGTATLMTGLSDMGNGSVTLQTMIAGEILGMKPEHFAVIQTDSEAVTNDFGSYASRGTYVGGSAALKAAKSVRNILAKEASKLLEVPCEDLEFYDEKVTSITDKTKSATLKEVMDYARTKTMRDVSVTETFASFDSPICYGAHMCKVRVDSETGEVKVLDYVSVHDIGKALNPGNLEGQMHGGVHMGLGYALSEEVLRDENGRITNNNLNKYRIFKAADMPNIKTFMIEEIETSGPFGAKSIGECAVVPSAPAIVNAVSNAIGKELFSIPLTKEKVLAAISSN